MNKDDIEKKYDRAQEILEQTKLKLAAIEKEMHELRHMYWVLTDGFQLNDVVTNGAKTGVIYEIEIQDYKQLKNLSPSFKIKMFKKDGTLGERIENVYWADKWKVIGKHA